MPAKVATVDTTRTGPATSPCSTTPTAPRATSSRPRALRRDRVESGRGCRHPARQRAAAARDPDRHRGPQRRARPRARGRLGLRRRLRIQVVAKEGDRHLRLPSSETRMVRAGCRATVGALSNSEHQNVKIGKAGRRHKGKPPADAGRRDEPGRPPARRGRGAPHARRTSGDPVGEADARLPAPTGKGSDAKIIRGRRRGKRRGKLMGRSTKKGPFVDERLMRRISR